MFRTRGYLPHLESERAIYFVTFRLADSLPRELVEELRREKAGIEKADRAGVTVEKDRVRLSQLRGILRRVQQQLDDGRGQCYMRDSRIAKIVADAILRWDRKRYRILSWCVMPNHVHVVFSLLGANELEEVLHSWKSFSSKAANRILGRNGRFWQREYFDHLIRNEFSLARIVRYVKENPEKAGLKNWPWVGVA